MGGDGVVPGGSQGGGARMLVGGAWIARDEVIEVRNPFDRRLVDTVPRGTPADIASAIAAAVEALDEPWPVHARCDVLTRAAARLEADQEGYARTIALEGSKTIREARREPVRCVSLLRLAAEEGRRLAGETLPFDSRPGSENRIGYYFRFPVGIVGAITPFNDPLAMACHKVGPALAGGNAVVLKPGTATPLSALRLARDLVGEGEFFEVHVDTPLAVAEARDVKGLYKKARRGELKNFTGIDSPYEAPEHPEIYLDTTRTTPEEAAEAIVERLRLAGRLGAAG